ncbi:MAG: ATP-binding protein [Chlamydiae bacterium]|nr:ATP-binding protein [Chlamydiota bacterium]
MSESLIHQLQAAVDKALQSKNTEDGLKHLATAFSLFSKETHRLENAYMMLQHRFKAVNNELEKTNLELRKKISDLGVVSSYLDNILKNISQGIVFIDTDGIVTTFNPSAQKILEKDESQVLFTSFWNNFADDFFGFSMKTALTLGLSQNLSYLTLNSLTEKKEIEVLTSFIMNCPKPYQGVAVILRDITEVQKLQLIANRNDRMKELGEMAATVAHEIRNPLGGIRGYASLLYRDLENSKHLQEMASFIIEGTKSLERLVNNVLHYSRPIILAPSQTDLVDLIKELIKSLKVDPSFPSNIKVDLHLSQNNFVILVDKHFLRSALLNLIVNAYQAIQDDGTITISLLQQNNFCCISISDTGQGIADKDLEKIFSPFFTTKQKGNGLGLSESYKIIQAHFGSIDVRSQVGKGTTFTINLPLKR